VEFCCPNPELLPKVVELEEEEALAPNGFVLVEPPNPFERGAAPSKPDD
jgi:hypothetical protein